MAEGASASGSAESAGGARLCSLHGKQRAVTVAVDSSERSLEAVTWAAKNLVHPGDAVTLLHVQERPDMQGGVLPLKDAPLSPEAIECLRTHISTLSRHSLQRAKEACAEAGVGEGGVETVALIGDPRDTICKFVQEHHSDMLVVGSRGLGPLQGQLLGSVSSYCVHHAAVPVVVVRTV